MENTAFSVIIMLIFAVIGFFAGAFFDDNAFDGAILFALISGIACIVHAIESKKQ